MEIQQLRLNDSTAGGMGLIPGWTNSHDAQYGKNNTFKIIHLLTTF